ncbi:ECF transporter S component [Bacillus lacus]|uniref:ECF transporter S component n=1 Tax=Metabacillus lacus TaxID=1983721 RepID=A0A7X2LYV9_9BACI|nr:ECF transporter S component [Metabacillus lacus]MRX71044.1 ECF transporter S component [Metabacillus lacus]
MSVKKISLLSLLAALAVAGRVSFQFIPNVQPMTAVIMITSILLGPLSGLIVAALGAFLSNLLMGMGYWTISQVAAWGSIAVLFGYLGKLSVKRMLMIGTPFAVAAGYLYGFIVSLPMFIMTKHGWLYYLSGLPFDTAHAVGNGIFFFILYPVMARAYYSLSDRWLYS